MAMDVQILTNITALLLPMVVQVNMVQVRQR
jgi:hypothetical protein